MDKLPDYLIENYIIPYLSSYDLFYKFRTLSPYYYYCSRNKILTHFPSEMMKTLKKIIDFNNKEDLTKKFDEITKKTFNVPIYTPMAIFKIVNYFFNQYLITLEKDINDKMKECIINLIFYHEYLPYFNQREIIEFLLQLLD